MIRQVQRISVQQYSSHLFSSLAGSSQRIVAFNSLQKKKLPILNKYPGVLNWYVCGPTVYDSTHIGHAW